MPGRSPLRPDGDRSFLGTGWAFPVTLTAAGGVALADHEDDIRQALRIILGTNLGGDRLLRPDFGSGLRDFAFEPISTTTLALLRHRVADAVTRWEPRVDGVEVETRVPPSPAGTLVEISIRYRVRATNTFYNLVYPFYLDEATTGLPGGAR